MRVIDVLVRIALGTDDVEVSELNAKENYVVVNGEKLDLNELLLKLSKGYPHIVSEALDKIKGKGVY